jgi:hypothetical protein
VKKEYGCEMIEDYLWLLVDKMTHKSNYLALKIAKRNKHRKRQHKL